MPISKKWLEISSCSNCEDFQSRRGKIRIKNQAGEKYYPHTLNGSALAVDRLITTLCEYYYQEKENKLAVPEVLQKYFRRVKCEGMFFLSVGLFGLDRLFGHSNNVMHSFTQSAFTCISRLDSVLLKVPGVQRIAWKIGIVAQL